MFDVWIGDVELTTLVTEDEEEIVEYKGCRYSGTLLFINK